MSVSILFPVLLKSEDSSEVLFMDFSTSSLYRATGELASEEQRDEVLLEIAEQQRLSTANVPYDQIREVMNTEKRLSSENAKHIFRRGQ
jgi:hypothetical protein